MVNIIKTFSVIALLFLTFINKSYSEIVEKLEANGNDRVSLETIAIFGDIQLGKDYQPDDINILIKNFMRPIFFQIYL